ncbi:TetR/AcrR family transcriptional regulator [Nocardioides zeae]|uniref:AcrR family transcriptional regulator n=1 Tax=Nocardioides zeae TaxID=1457234 RepID=A0AAJ1U1X3_9ACTN|nr:TetR/AcrR family transcriptional regulator [Nocardioides zeae]MDQ1103693.1 AcrR family transcriptional regulator [Nocardioides zeae]
MPRVGLTPDRVTVAGAELADEVGFASLTVTAVAQRLGVQQASVYAHVGGVRDLQVRIAHLALAELADATAEAVAGRSAGAALTAYAAAFRAYVRAHPGRYAAMRMPLEPTEAASSAGPRYAATTRALLRGYAVPEEDANHAVRLVGALLHGFVSLELGGSFDHSEPPAEQSWHRAVAALDTLLTTWNAPEDA